MKVLFIVAILASLTPGYRLTDECDDLGSQCVSISNCDVLKQLIQKSSQDRDTVKQYHCGFDGDVPRVCCPPLESNKCTTREGTLGTCVSLKTCSHLLELKNSGRKEDIEYVQRSRCDGSEHYRVCCDTTIDSSSNSIETNGEFRLSKQTLAPENSTHKPSNETSNNETQCGIEAASQNKIIGGTETAIDEYPWLAMLEYERPNLCGGTLISSFYVLTAAHCLVGNQMKPLGVKSVLLGEYNITNDGKDCVEVEGDRKDCTDGAVSISINQIIVHPEYQTGYIYQANDIGLLRLSESAPYSDFIRPICLPSSDITKVAISSNLRFHIAGWGAVSQQRPGSAVKLHVDLPAVDQKTCEKRYSWMGKPIIWDKQMCAGGEKDKDACKGDSGGPLIYLDDDSNTHQIVGITSFGVLQCGNGFRPSIYTKVIEYVPWIVATTKVWIS